MPKSSRKAPAAAPDKRLVNAHGQEFQASKLTGNRAQRGNLPGGAPCWVYEVVWSGNHKNKYLGCPASSATVERLFSQVGIAFSDRRKTSKANTIADIIFTKLNVP